MMTSSSRVVRNTVWQLQPAFHSNIRDSHDARSVTRDTVALSPFRQTEQELRAELSKRLAKLCNYSGKSPRR